MRPLLARSFGRQVFGQDPAGYDRARPGHAEDVYAVLVERCALRSGTSVLEIGPGTGQATRRLLELGARPLVALEPDPALAEYLHARIGDSPQVIVAPLEEADLPSSSFDLAVAASSFHWVDEELALSKLLTALRPGGWVALWWTLFGDETRPDPFMDAVDPVLADVPRAPSRPAEGRPSFARDAEGRLAALRDAGFVQPVHEEFHWSHTWDEVGIRGLYSTFSPILALEPKRRRKVLDDIERIARIDFEGHVSRPLVTSLYTARKPS